MSSARRRRSAVLHCGVAQETKKYELALAFFNLSCLMADFAAARLDAFLVCTSGTFKEVRECVVKHPEPDETGRRAPTRNMVNDSEREALLRAEVTGR